MSDKKDNGGFHKLEAKANVSSKLSLGGKMSKEGADQAGRDISTGIKWFLILGVVLLFVYGMYSTRLDYEKAKLMQPTAQSSYSPASSHTNSAK